MKYYSKQQLSYPQRLKMLEEHADIYSLILHYLRVEPHTLLHIGKLNQFLRRCGMTQSRILSLGIDVLKEMLLLELNHAVQLTVADIDVQCVQACNVFTSAHNRVSYVDFNLLVHDVAALESYGPFDTLMLLQMDYQFTDEDIKTLASKARQLGIINIVILSPSLFELINAKNPLIWLRNAIDIFLLVQSSLISKFRYKHNAASITFRRSVSHLSRLFEPYYTLQQKSHYNYPSGTSHLLLFSS